jgi:nicotinate phosphoribosyltransferase
VPRALERVVRLAARLRQGGPGRIGAVRIDSGDLGGLARLARGVLDAGGCGDIRIVASGDLDEYRIAALMAQGAPIDMFGVGTRVSTSADAPFLDCAYKLSEYGGKGRRKRSPGKESWPGRKQVYRREDADGSILHDTLGLEGEAVPGRPLLEAVMRDGKPVGARSTLPDLRRQLQAQLATLAPALRGLAPAAGPPVLHSPGLLRLGAEVDRDLQ